MPWGRWAVLGRGWQWLALGSQGDLLTLCSCSRTLLASAALKWRARTLATNCQTGVGGGSATICAAPSSRSTFSSGFTTRLSLELGPML